MNRKKHPANWNLLTKTIDYLKELIKIIVETCDGYVTKKSNVHWTWIHFFFLIVTRFDCFFVRRNSHSTLRPDVICIYSPSAILFGSGVASLNILPSANCCHANFQAFIFIIFYSSFKVMSVFLPIQNSRCFEKNNGFNRTKLQFLGASLCPKEFSTFLKNAKFRTLFNPSLKNLCFRSFKKS